VSGDVGSNENTGVSANKIKKQMVLDAGFGVCEYHNLSGGIVALHKGIKT
jgi:ubiquinone/menaquinone biosynthesis C-methylase UbiE